MGRHSKHETEGIKACAAGSIRANRRDGWWFGPCEATSRNFTAQGADFCARDSSEGTGTKGQARYVRAMSNI